MPAQFPSSLFSICFVSVQIVHPISKRTQPELERNPTLFYLRDHVSIIDKAYFDVINNRLDVGADWMVGWLLFFVYVCIL